MHLCSYISPFRLGHLDDALTELQDAIRRGPNWPDSLEAWGDVLVKQSKIKEALAKYDETLQACAELEAAQGIARGNGAVRPNYAAGELTLVTGRVAR